MPSAAAAVPIPLSPIVGRTVELRHLETLLKGARLVTLIGAGGSGKTRLAIELGVQAAATETTAWVDLTPFSDPALVPQQVAALLAARPAPGQDPTAALVAALRSRQLRVVFDNCEHLVESVAVLVETLLSTCPAISVLATSREPLGLHGERVWLVPMLSLPPREALATAASVSTSEAIQLFTERAREANPAFRLTDANAGAVATVCRRLDGLPLALELAAARTRMLSVQQIAERLDDAFGLLTRGGRTSLPRQKTLRGTLDWSFDLLAPRERLLLPRLAVFASSFGLEAVEAICPGEGVEPSQVLDAMAALVDRSLVVIELVDDEARYRLLETMRQYGLERLRAERPEEETWLRRRHATFYTALAERFEPQLFCGPRSPSLLPMVAAEHDDFRSAFEWALATAGDTEIALRLSAALHWYWYSRGLLAEGLKHVQDALDRDPLAPAIRRARAECARGLLLSALGRPREALAGLGPVAEALRNQDDPPWRIYALTLLAANSLAEDPAAASRRIAAASAEARLLPASVLTGFVLCWQGRVAQAREDRQGARSAFESWLALVTKLGHASSIANALSALAELERGEDRLEIAAQLALRALALHGELDDRWGMMEDSWLLAQVSARTGEAMRAARLVAVHQQLAGALGDAEAVPGRSPKVELSHELRGQLGEACFEAVSAEGRKLGASGLLPILQRDLAAAAGPPRICMPIAADGEACCDHPLALPSVGLAHSTVDSPAGSGLGGRLEVRALGPLEVELSGSTASAGAWSSARTRELLVFLLLHPRGATKEEIGLALWPEASASQLRNSFHVTLHRLRSAFGRSDWVSTDAGRYFLGPDLAVSFDVPRFEEQALSALSALKKNPGGVAELVAALELYRGELLAGEPGGEWLLAHRERLEQLFLESLAAASRALEASSRFAEAAALYRRWIATDDLAEQAYRRLMICLEATGERAEALKLYRRLVTILERELDVEPEPETQAVFHRLR